MKKLIWATEDGNRYLAFDSQYQSGEPAPDASAAEMVELCDRNAEGQNRHDFCGVHAKLADLLGRHVDAAAVAAIVRDIAQQGGLHGMNCGEW